jgi:hypothetical protein
MKIVVIFLILGIAVGIIIGRATHKGAEHG